MCDDLHEFEQRLAYVCVRCEYAYSAMGATGYLYASAKDNLKWNGIKPKEWIHIVMDVGHLMALNKEDFDKAVRVKKKRTDGDLAAMLISAFGDGKER
jgi:hypothetical protein